MRAMVLCAGYGTRLGSLTSELPKPMLTLGRYPLLEYILCNLLRSGFDDIAINLHFRPEIIQGYFGDGRAWGANLRYSHEESLLGTAGGVKKMGPFLRGAGPFLVHYGDILTDQDFTALRRFHQERGALATLLVHQRPRSMSAVEADASGRIVRFLERPTEEERQLVASPWVFSGVALCEPDLLDVIPDAGRCDLPGDVFTRLTATGRLFAFPLAGGRYAIDSAERLAEARAEVERGHYNFPRLGAAASARRRANR